MLPLIDQLQPKRVLIALDADFRTNVAVAAALRGLMTSLSASRGVAVETWPLDHGQGIDDLLAAGRSPIIVEGDDLAILLAELPATATAVASQNDRVEITVGTDEHRVNDDAVAALAGEEELFARAGLLMRMVGEDAVQDGIVRPRGAKRICVLLRQTLREFMTRRIQFVETKIGHDGDLHQKPVHPPGWCVSADHARGAWPGVRPLRAIVTCPAFRADGSILSTNGYDPLTGRFLSSVFELPPIPAKPTRDDAVRAADALLNVTVDFPFARAEHRAAWLAFVLTPLARHAFCGPSPLFPIDANTRGSGKSLLAHLGGIIATGRTLACMANPKDDEECRPRRQHGSQNVRIRSAVLPGGISTPAQFRESVRHGRNQSRDQEEPGSVPRGEPGRCREGSRRLSGCSVATDLRAVAIRRTAVSVRALLSEVGRRQLGCQHSSRPVSKD